MSTTKEENPWPNSGKPPAPFWGRATKGRLLHLWEWNDIDYWTAVCGQVKTQPRRAGDKPPKRPPDKCGRCLLREMLTNEKG